MLFSFVHGIFEFRVEYDAPPDIYRIRIFGQGYHEYVAPKGMSFKDSMWKSLEVVTHPPSVVMADVAASMLYKNAYGYKILWDYFDNNKFVPEHWKTNQSFKEGLDRLAKTISTGGSFKSKMSIHPMEKYYSGGYISKEHLTKSLWDDDESWASYKKKFFDEEQPEYSLSNKVTSASASADFSTKSHKLPGVGEVVNHPSSNYHKQDCRYHEKTDLWRLIQHLNDSHRMTRDEIADWVETLDIDINFKVDA